LVMAFFASIRISLKGLRGSNALAYLARETGGEKSFIAPAFSYS
jgi:hypothetical protein